MKLRPLPFQVHISNDGYRGEKEIVWKMHPINPQRSLDLFGTWCERCKQGYGWTHDIAFVRRLYRLFKKFGCKKCRK